MKFSLIYVVLLVLLCLPGCSAKAPAVSYYSLTPVEQSGSAIETQPDLDLAIGVGPVTVPEYLKRAQIATRQGENRYQFDEFNRWAGLIEKDIATVIGNNLGLLLGTDRIMFFPWMHYFKPEYRVVVEIIQLDSELNGDAVLSARWAISDAAGKEILASGKSDYRQPLSRSTYEALVAAESMTMADFSREIADELRRLAGR